MTTRTGTSSKPITIDLTERQRGDTYRARALALLVSCRASRIEVRTQLTALKIGECFDVAVPLISALTAERDAASIWKARAAEAGLRAEGLAGLLRTARQWHGHACECLAVVISHAADGTIDMEACDCGWRELAAELDAALAAMPRKD